MQPLMCFFVFSDVKQCKPKVWRYHQHHARHQSYQWVLSAPRTDSCVALPLANIGTEILLFFRCQHKFAFHLPGTADPIRAEYDLLLPLQGLSDHPRVHPGCDMDCVWEPHPSEHGAGQNKRWHLILFDIFCGFSFESTTLKTPRSSMLLKKHKLKVHNLMLSFHKFELNSTVNLLFLQLAAFSELQFSDRKPMVGNFRPVQPLNGRQVFRSGSPVILASSILLVGAIATALGLSQPN